MNFKDYDVEVKEFGDKDGGYIVAYASTFHRDPDAYGDIVRKGAFTNSLAKWEQAGKPIPLLFGHRTDDPAMNIGAVVEASEDDTGLLVKATFDADSETAQYCRKLVKEGRLYKLSFAYDVLDNRYITLEDGRKANELLELDIFEVSLVPIPANQHAQVVEVKDGEPEFKAGRVISAKNEDKLTQAAALINEVLAQLSESSDGESANEKAATAEEKEAVAVSINPSLILRMTDAEGNVLKELDLSDYIQPSDQPGDGSEVNSEETQETEEGDSSATEASDAGEKGAPEVDWETLARLYQTL